MLNIEIKASSRYPIRRKRIKEKIEEVLDTFNVRGEVEIELNIIGDRKMKKMKKEYLGIDETTDVLSFPLHENLNNGDNNFIDFPDGVLRLGSIFVSYPQAQRQANLHKLLIDDEIDQLVEHGMFHLLGIHHD